MPKIMESEIGPPRRLSRRVEHPGQRRLAQMLSRIVPAGEQQPIGTRCGVGEQMLPDRRHQGLPNRHVTAEATETVAVSTVTRALLHRSYSRSTTSAQVGFAKPSTSDARFSTLLRCSV